MDWWISRLQDNGRLSEDNLESEYQRGFVDCWNKVLQFDRDGVPFWE